MSRFLLRRLAGCMHRCPGFWPGSVDRAIGKHPQRRLRQLPSYQMKYEAVFEWRGGDISFRRLEKDHQEIDIQRGAVLFPGLNGGTFGFNVRYWWKVA